MDHITTREFLDWAVERNVVPDARYSHSERDYYNLRFATEQSEAVKISQVWEIPYQTDENQQDEVRLYYVSAALQAMDSWQTVGVLKKERGWPRAEIDPWEAVVLAPLGIPDSYDGALRFDRSEFAALYSIALTLSVFGWNVAFDLFIVPDHGEQMLQFNHDHGVIGIFASEAARDRFTARMRAREISPA